MSTSSHRCSAFPGPRTPAAPWRARRACVNRERRRRSSSARDARAQRTLRRASPHRIFGLGSVSLNDVKRVKNHFGVKVNDVVVAWLPEAFAGTSLATASCPTLPSVARCRSRCEPRRNAAPRQPGLRHDRRHPDPSGRRGRAPAFVHEKLVGPPRSATARSRPRHCATSRTFLPPAVHTRAARAAFELTARRMVRPLFNVIVSNVPGPPMDIYSGGARLEALYPLSIIADGIGPQRDGDELPRRDRHRDHGRPGADSRRTDDRGRDARGSWNASSRCAKPGRSVRRRRSTDAVREGQDPWARRRGGRVALADHGRRCQRLRRLATTAIRAAGSPTARAT